MRSEIFVMLLSVGSYCELGRDMQELYRDWCTLNKEQKEKMSLYVETHVATVNLPLYDTLLKAFEQWDHFQNAFGAPGWHCRSAIDYFLTSKKVQEVKRFIVRVKDVREVFAKEICENEDEDATLNQIGNYPSGEDTVSQDSNFVEKMVSKAEIEMNNHLKNTHQYQYPKSSVSKLNLCITKNMQITELEKLELQSECDNPYEVDISLVDKLQERLSNSLKQSYRIEDTHSTGTTTPCNTENAISAESEDEEPRSTSLSPAVSPGSIKSTSSGTESEEEKSDKTEADKTDGKMISSTSPASKTYDAHPSFLESTGENNQADNGKQNEINSDEEDSAYSASKDSFVTQYLDHIHKHSVSTILDNPKISTPGNGLDTLPEEVVSDKDVDGTESGDYEYIKDSGGVSNYPPNRTNVSSEKVLKSTENDVPLTSDKTEEGQGNLLRDAYHLPSMEIEKFVHEIIAESKIQVLNA